MAVQILDANTLDDFSSEMVDANTKAVVWSLPYVEHNLTLSPMSAVRFGTRLIRDAINAYGLHTDEGRALSEKAVEYSADWLEEITRHNAALKDRLEEMLAE